MQTANGLSAEDSSQVSMKTRGAKIETSYQLKDVRMVKDLPLRRQIVDINKMAATWEHLRKVEMDSLKDAKPTILIGQDHGHLIVAEECIQGPPKTPILSRTALGWVIHGNVAQGRGVSNEILQCHWMKDARDEVLHLLVKDSFKTESFGIKVLAEKPRSKEDQRAERIMKATTKCVCEHFEIGLVWWDNDPEFPESKSMAIT